MKDQIILQLMLKMRIILILVMLFVTNLLQAQTEVSNNRKPIVVLPDILIERDTIIVTNNNKGSFTTIGSKTPAYLFKDMKDYREYLRKYKSFFYIVEGELKGYVLIKFTISKEGCIHFNFVSSFDKSAEMMMKDIVLGMKGWIPAMNEKGETIEAEGCLVALFDVEPKKYYIKRHIDK